MNLIVRRIEQIPYSMTKGDKLRYLQKISKRFIDKHCTSSLYFPNRNINLVSFSMLEVFLGCWKNGNSV